MDPSLFRAVIRATIEGAEGAKDQPGNKLAAVLLSSLAGGQVDFVSHVLGELAERANHPAFVAENQRSGSLEFMTTHCEGFAEGFLTAAKEFSTTADTTVGTILATGAPDDEARWLLALAIIEAEMLATPAAAQGATPRFVVFRYCVSLGIVSFKRSSGIKMIQPGGSALLAGLPYTLVSLVAGWWGISWGPIWTLQTILRNLGGGIDVTAAIEAAPGRIPASV